MSELANIQDNCPICDRMIEGREITWDTYFKELSEYLSHMVGIRCGNCGAVFCGKDHKKELGFKLFGSGSKLFNTGYMKSPCTQCGEPLGAGRVLIGASKDQMLLFQYKLEDGLAKRLTYMKFFLYWAGISTVLTILLIALLPNYDFDSTYAGACMGFIALGIFTWPFYFYNKYQKTKAKKMLEKMPPPGKERLQYAIKWYEDRKWERLPPKPSGAGEIRMQEKKRFNILIALFGFLFGIIGLLFYLQEYNKPSPVIEMELTQEGLVVVKDSP